LNNQHTTGEEDTIPIDRQISPLQMGQVVQEQGQEIQNMLRLFKQTTSTPLSGCLLQTPQDK
jgi:hypothetical protein